MSRRVIGLVIAVILALVGTVALVAFVAGAEERALEGEELVEVYVVTELIGAGTEGEELEELVVVEEVPTKVRPDNAVDNLAALRGRVAAVDLQPGEQLIRHSIHRGLRVRRSRGRSRHPGGHGGGDSRARPGSISRRAP